MISCKNAGGAAGLLVFLLVGQAPVNQPVAEPAPIPETGYVSDSRYVNAFFGFSLPLPQDADFQDFALPSKGNSHSIFGLKAQRKGLTALTVSATQSTGNPADDARKAAAGRGGASVKKVDIAGREFWKSESEEHSRAGTMHTLIYATAMNGYALQFMVVSFDGKLAKELGHSIETITFINSGEAKAMAGSNARLFPAKAEGISNAPVSSTHMSQLDLGVVSNNVYTNHVLGFSFQFPDGWVVADKATQDKVVEAGHQFAYGNDVAAAREHQVAQSCSKIFLLVNQYPQGTKTDAVNPLIAIMAFDSACLPGVQMPRSIEDADKIRQLGNQFSDALAGTRFLGEGQYTIRAFMVQNRLMLDLSSAFKTNLPSRKQPLDVFSSFVFTEDNGYWVAWLFMDGTQAGLDDLKKNIRISFVPSGSATDHK